jgi:hypothetical protein
MFSGLQHDRNQLHVEWNSPGFNNEQRETVKSGARPISSRSTHIREVTLHVNISHHQKLEWALEYEQLWGEKLNER